MVWLSYSDVVMSLAIVCVVLRDKRHLDGSHCHGYDKITTGDSHVYVD